MKLEEKLMIAAGVLLLASLPFLSGSGFYVWLTAKLMYGIGVAIMWASNR